MGHKVPHQGELQCRQVTAYFRMLLCVALSCMYQVPAKLPTAAWGTKFHTKVSCSAASVRYNVQQHNVQQHNAFDTWHLHSEALQYNRAHSSIDLTCKRRNTVDDTSRVCLA
jgi:hypothetical protein